MIWFKFYFIFKDDNLVVPLKWRNYKDNQFYFAQSIGQNEWFSYKGIKPMYAFTQLSIESTKYSGPIVTLKYEQMTFILTNGLKYCVMINVLLYNLTKICDQGYWIKKPSKPF